MIGNEEDMGLMLQRIKLVAAEAIAMPGDDIETTYARALAKIQRILNPDAPQVKVPVGDRGDSGQLRIALRSVGIVLNSAARIKSEPCTGGRRLRLRDNTPYLNATAQQQHALTQELIKRFGARLSEERVADKSYVVYLTNGDAPYQRNTSRSASCAAAYHAH